MKLTEVIWRIYFHAVIWRRVHPTCQLLTKNCSKQPEKPSALSHRHWIPKLFVFFSQSDSDFCLFCSCRLIRWSLYSVIDSEKHLIVRDQLHTSSQNFFTIGNNYKSKVNKEISVQKIAFIIYHRWEEVKPSSWFTACKFLVIIFKYVIFMSSLTLWSSK